MIVNVICLIIFFCRHLCFGGNESHLVVCPIVQYSSFPSSLIIFALRNCKIFRFVWKKVARNKIASNSTVFVTKLLKTYSYISIYLLSIKIKNNTKYSDGNRLAWSKNLQTIIKFKWKKNLMQKVEWGKMMDGKKFWSADYSSGVSSYNRTLCQTRENSFWRTSTFPRLRSPFSINKKFVSLLLKLFHSLGSCHLITTLKI